MSDGLKKIYCISCNKNTKWAPARKVKLNTYDKAERYVIERYAIEYIGFRNGQ